MQYLLLLFFFPILIGCKTSNERTYTVNIKHYMGGEGSTLYYSIDNKRITLETNCDLEGCERKRVYSKSLSSKEKETFYNFLHGLEIDTLKAKYENPEVQDGLNSIIEINLSNKTTKRVIISNYKVPAVHLLYEKIDNLIDSSKYQFINY